MYYITFRVYAYLIYYLIEDRFGMISEVIVLKVKSDANLTPQVAKNLEKL